MHIRHAVPVGREEPRVLVVVNGVPGSGKTTLARRLSAATVLPHLSKDRLKDHLASTMSTEPSPAELSSLAGRVMWELVAAHPSGAIVETWFGPTGREAVEQGAARAGIDRHRVLEVWCEVPIDLARDRFRARLGTPGRSSWLDAAGREDAYWAELSDTEPLGLARLRRVSTADVVSPAELADLLAEVASLRLH